MVGVVMVPLICFFDGKLIDDNRNANYIGGHNKVNMVSKAIGFADFKKQIQEMINLPPNGIGFEIKCEVQFSENNVIAIDVNDEKSLRFIMEHSNLIRAYIIKQLPSETQREEELLPSNLGNQLSIETHGDKVNNLPEDLDNEGDVDSDDNLGDEVNPPDDVHDRVNLSPLHMIFHQSNVNACQNFSTGNCEDNQGDGTNKSGDMHIEENVYGPQMEERLSTSGADNSLQESNCGVNSSSHHSAPSDLSAIDFDVGREYPDIDAFRNALSDFAVRTGAKYKPVRTTKSKLKMKCKAEGCNWHIQANSIGSLPTFKVVKYQNKHSCSGHQRKGNEDHCQATIKWIVSKIQSNIKDNPEMGPRDLINEIENRFGIRISTNKAMKAKNKVLDLVRINDLFKESYALLPRLKEELERVGCVTKLGGNMDGSFKYFCWAFPACIHALRHLRPVLCIVTIPIKLGVLFRATSYDEDLCGLRTIDVAFGIFEGEDELAWELFLEYLKEFMDPLPCDPFTIWTNFNIPSATRAFEKVLPNVHRRFFSNSVERIFQNSFRKIMTPALKKYFLKAIHTCIPGVCEDALQEIKGINETAYEWLVSIGLKHWTNAFSNTHTEDRPLDHYWKLHRLDKLPIVNFVLGTRDMVAQYFSIRRNDSVNLTTSLMPGLMRSLQYNKLLTLTWTVKYIGGFKYDVFYPDGVEVVDLEKKSCSCCEFQLYGYPCKHACKAIIYENLDATDYCKSWFTTETYRATYAEEFPPIADILTPTRRVGRPRKKISS